MIHILSFIISIGEFLVCKISKAESSMESLLDKLFLQKESKLKYNVKIVLKSTIYDKRYRVFSCYFFSCYS